MRNIWLIFRRDVSNLFRNVMCVIITVGLVVLPSLFAWYNVLACWNVFDNTGNLSVAVASNDEGYSSDLLPIEINVGEKVTSALRANSQINWVFTNGDDAVEGTKSGKYYAALVIPENFSRQMLTFYEGDSESAEILYYVNEKKNAISPNITGAGADTLSYEVNATFADTLSEIAVGLAKSVWNYTEENDATSKLSGLTSHIRATAANINQTANVLGVYSSLGDESRDLLNATSSFVESARSRAESTVSGIDSDKQVMRELAVKLANASDSLSNTLERAKSAVTELDGKVDTLLGDAAAEASDIAANLRSARSDIDARTAELITLRDELSKLRDELHDGAVRERQKMIKNGNTEAEISTYVELTIENTTVIDEAIAILNKAISTMQKASTDLDDAAGKLEAAGPALQQDVDALRNAIATANAELESAVDDFAKNLKPGIEKLKSDLEKLIADLDSAATNLDAVSVDLPGVANDVDATLGELSSKINDACDKLRMAAQDMTNLADSIDAALASGDIDTLRELLSDNSEAIAAALSAPVQIQREALFPVDNFGSAMTPLYCTLAVFIGALLIMVATKPEVSRRGMEELHNPKPRHLYFGRFGVAGLLSLLQTTLLGLGCMLFLKVQVANPLLFMICFWIAGLVFAFMIYTMVVAFGNLGKALAVMLLIVQVTACGGSYPLPIMPDFVQYLSHLVPATHVVDALRAAMFGVYQNDFWISIGKLTLFFIPFLLLGLALRKPLDGFMKFYVSKVEESKIIE